MAVSYKIRSIKSTNVRLFIRMKQIPAQVFFSLAWFLARPLAKSLVLRLFFTPISHALTDREKRAEAWADKFHFRSGRHTLQGYQWGKGPAVVFVHGWAGRGLQCASHVRDLVKAGFSVYAFDHVGHGRSGSSASNYFEFSNAVAAFMAAFPDLEIKALVAHSLGGSAVLNYLWKTRIPVRTILVAPALTLRQTLARTFERFGLPRFLYRAILRELGDQTGHNLDREDPCDLIRHLTSDLVIVHDTQDRAVPYEDSWKASLTQSNIRLYPTQGLGHIRILENPIMGAEFLRLLST